MKKNLVSNKNSIKNKNIIFHNYNLKPSTLNFKKEIIQLQLLKNH